MSIDKIKPFNDPRVSYRSAHLNGLTYGYLYSAPLASTPSRGTVILIHGFPDISFGWRYQIPYLTSLGLTCIAPDCIGYGRTDSPAHTLQSYTFRRLADDIAELCRQLSLKSIILGGHDWGGACVYRIAEYYPSLIQAAFVICTPYPAPSPTYTPLHTLVRTLLPNFGYQIQFASGTLETHIQSPHEIRQFLSNLYGARTEGTEGTKGGKYGFSAETGVDLDTQRHLGPPKLLDKDELDYYVQEYSRHGVHGPLNWYRTREANFLDEQDFFYGGASDSEPSKGDSKAKRQPGVRGKEVLFVLATKDQALKPEMARNMSKRIEKLTRREVEAGHWVLWQKPEEVNGMIGKWLMEKVWGETSSSDLTEGGRASKL